MGVTIDFIRPLHAQAADGARRAEEIQVAAPTLLAPVTMEFLVAASWMRMPLGRIAGFSSCTTRPAHAQLLSHGVRTFLSRAQRDDRGLLHHWRAR